MSEKIKVTKTKTALKQEPYNPSDLKHDLQCGFVELGDIVPYSDRIVRSTILSLTNYLLAP